MIQAYGLTERVHVLGSLDRSKLGDVYQGALATIVPSLDEQDSWPICEAIHWQCPVACSDIFPVREQCAPMGDAMLYFDPRDPDAIARIILQIRNDRKGTAARQHSASRGMWTRTWADVAREWLTVFREAAKIGCRPGFENSERAVA